jgi:hypothetical protein
VLELVVEEEALGMPSEQPPEHLLARVPHPEPDLTDGGLERLVVPKAAASERLLDRVVEVVALEPSHPARALPPDPYRSQDLTLADPSTEQHRDAL